MANTGTLKVRVFLTQAQLPLEGATVVVTRKGVMGKDQLLSVQATDSSGAIRPVEVETPAAGESTAPGHAGPPYALCSVWAEHPGYSMLQVEGVQVFPGVETLQQMELIPLSQNESSLQQRDMREIDSQSL